MSVGFLGVHGPDCAYRFQGARPAGALASLEDLYLDCGDCSCPRESQGSVAMPVTLEFLRKEAIAPELQGGGCLDHTLSL